MLNSHLSANLTSQSDWYWITAKYRKPIFGKALWQLINTLVPYSLLWIAMVYAVERQLFYGITFVMMLVAAGLLVRIFILFHDCCHGSFFASRRANSVLGYVAGVLTFTSFEDWKYAHGLHHATAGNLERRGVGDIWTMTTEEYLAASRFKRIRYRIYRNPFILLGPGSILLFLFIQRFPTKGAGQRERKSVFFTNLAILFIGAMATWTVGFRTYLTIQLPVIMIAGSLGLWLFYLQHQFETVYWARNNSWEPIRVALEGSSYFRLPKILQWFTGNIGLHHIHHVRPNIPNYNLQQCCDEVRAFQLVEPVTIWNSLRSLRLSLYDEKSKKLVSFRNLAAANLGT